MPMLTSLKIIRLPGCQEWRDQRNNVKIQFHYSPDNPLVYTLTDLKFSNKSEYRKSYKRPYFRLNDNKRRKIFFKFDDVAIQNGGLSLSSLNKPFSLANLCDNRRSLSHDIIPLCPFYSFQNLKLKLDLLRAVLRMKRILFPWQLDISF